MDHGNVKRWCKVTKSVQWLSIADPLERAWVRGRRKFAGTVAVLKNT